MKHTIKEQSLDQNLIKEYNKVKLISRELRRLYNFRINKETYFLDDFWNFNCDNTKNRSKDSYTYHFDNIPYPFIFYIKITILHELHESKNSYGHAKRIYSLIKTVSRDLFDIGITDIRLIDGKVIKDYLESKELDCKPSYMEGIAKGVKKLLEAINDCEGYNYDHIIDYLSSKSREYSEARPIHALNNYIPDNFLNQIVSFAIKDMDNESLKMDERISACLIVIMAETGMRIEEVSLIETGMIDEIKVNDKKLCYLHFLTFKTKNYNGEGKPTFTFLTDKALRAYRLCEGLVNDVIDNLSESAMLKLLLYINTKKKINRYISISELRKKISDIGIKEMEALVQKSKQYLFISAITGKQKRSGQLLREHLEKFFVRHYKDFCIETVPPYLRKNIKTFHIGTKSKYEKFFSLEQRKELSFEDVKNIEYHYVNPHMFRVTVCTKLFMQKVHIDFIVKHLNHLSEDMSTFYSKQYELEDTLRQSTLILEEITNKDGLIETNPSNVSDQTFSSLLDEPGFKIQIEKINKFLKDNKLNIWDNIDKILKVMEKTDSPIEENELGICMRSVIFGICEKRKYFSTLTDKYNIGLQLETYRYMNYSYERFKEKAKIVDHNMNICQKDDRYLAEFEREENALKMYVKKTLCREIELLDSDILKYGKEKIIFQNPQLLEIVSNLDKIREEIIRWVV